MWPDTVKRGVDAPRRFADPARWSPKTSAGSLPRPTAASNGFSRCPAPSSSPRHGILELSDERVQQEALDAEFQLRAAEADLASVSVRLQNELLQQQSAAADIQAQFHRARITAEANEQLSKEGLSVERDDADLAGRGRRAREPQSHRAGTAEDPRRLGEAQLAAEQARVAQRRALYELRRGQIEALKVRAGIAGCCRSCPSRSASAWLSAPTSPAWPHPGRLKAELRIPETQAKDLEVGLKATIDTRNGEVEGRVARVDPAAQNGTVLVDVSFTGPLPRGARPDLSVDGTIELERLDNVLYVGRPAFGQENSTVSLFKLLGPARSLTRPSACR